MIHHCKLVMIIFLGAFLLFFTETCGADDCDDYKSIDYYAVGSYTWMHNMPTGCTAYSAEIELVIKVWTFNDYGTLDLICSNTNSFDYGSVTTAPNKPGFISRITRSTCPNSSRFYTLKFSLDSTQRSWLNDNGILYVALIGQPYGMYGFPAQFDLTSSRLIVNGGGTQPSISRDPVSLSNTCFEGSNAPNQNFNVWNSGEGTLGYSISDNAAWLSCSPINGTSTGEQDTITVTYTTSSLLPGNYAAIITISDSTASSSPQAIPVALMVTATSPDILISPSSFQIFNFSGPFDSPGLNPLGLAFDGTYLWNADPTDDKIYKLDTLGNIIDSFDSPGTGPSGLTFDGTYLWHSDYLLNKIYKIDTSGNIIDSFDSPGSNPIGLAFDGTYLWNADNGEDKIYKIDISGNVIHSFNSPGPIPKGLTFDGMYLWNTDYTDDRIYKMDTSGNIIDSFDSPGPSPSGLTFDGTYLWYADSLDDKIYKLDIAGHPVDYLYSPGPYPSGLAFDGTNLWNADYSDDKIYRLDAAGNIIYSFDSPGPGPSGLTFDGTYIWNSDPQNRKIYKLDTSGNIIDSFNSPGPIPKGLTFDGTYLWHADHTEDMIYKLDISGNIIDSFDSPGPSPVGLSFDGTYLWNVDDTDDKVYKLDFSGNILDSFDSPGPWPDGLTFDGTNLWCTDKTDDIISKLCNEPGPAEVGSSKSRSFTITNAGDTDLEIGTLGITGADALDFTIDNDLCSGQTIGLPGKCTVDVIFSPASSGEKTANLEIPSNDPDTPILVVILDSNALDFKTDFNRDGDVDGSDLAEFAANFDAGGIAAFAAEFGG